MDILVGIRKGNNAGLFVTTGANDLLHTLPANRTAFIRKILWYNNTGAGVTLIFGTLSNVAGWVPLFPTILAINALDGGYEEALIPAVEFVNDRTAAAGTTGNIHVQASAAGVLIRLEVEEFGV